ncbi:ABC transporter permease [Halobacteria archaeon AArc-dxtr1]|nr:ABC transporter permease [Halobacteria archaeon AArc-dxtr1]
MSTTLLARKDFEDAIRSKMIWAVMGVFVFLMGIIAVGAATDNLSEAEPTEVIGVVANIGGLLLIPILALLVGYMAIVGERQSGSLRVLFGLSHSRWDVFAGKLLSRLGVIAIASVVACLVAIVIAVGLFEDVPIGTFLGFSVLTILLGMAFTAIGVGVSAMASSRMQAMAGAIGSYVVFTLVWHPAVTAVHYLVEGELPGLEAPEWYFFLLSLNPLEAYRAVSSELADQFIWPMLGWQNMIEDIPEETMQEPNALLVSNRVSGDLPFYLSDWFAAVILLFWIVLPLAIGYWWFERADLN